MATDAPLVLTPKVTNACELGFGQGVSIAIHAAAQPHVNWFGDDFNPDHVLHAQPLDRNQLPIDDDAIDQSRHVRIEPPLFDHRIDALERRSIGRSECRQRQPDPRTE